MPTSRYRDRRGRATCRFRSSKNLILAGDFASIILILWIFFILFFPILFNAGKIIPSRSSLFVFFDGLGLDYPAIFYQSVPGMKLEQGESERSRLGFGDNSTDSEKHFHSYPQLVLINEIAGFKLLMLQGLIIHLLKQRIQNVIIVVIILTRSRIPPANYPSMMIREFLF